MTPVVQQEFREKSEELRLELRWRALLLLITKHCNKPFAPLESDWMNTNRISIENWVNHVTMSSSSSRRVSSQSQSNNTKRNLKNHYLVKAHILLQYHVIISRCAFISQSLHLIMIDDFSRNIIRKHEIHTIFRLKADHFKKLNTWQKSLAVIYSAWIIYKYEIEQ